MIVKPRFILFEDAKQLHVQVLDNIRLCNKLNNEYLRYAKGTKFEEGCEAVFRAPKSDRQKVWKLLNLKGAAPANFGE